MTVAQLVAAINATAHTPCYRVLIDGRPVQALEIDIDLGYDTVSAAATLLLPVVPSWLAFRQEVEIRLGYDGHLEAVTFYGLIEDDGRGYFPFGNTIKAVGRLRLTQYDYPSEVSYEDDTDTEIINDLLERAGISAGQRSVDGEDQAFGTVAPVVLQAGQPVWSLINRLNQVTGYACFDCPDGTVRNRRTSGLPAPTVAWAYVQGTNILSISRQRSNANVRNKVIVKGLPLADGTQPSDTRQADSAYVPDPPRYIAFSLQDDLIETDAYAETVGVRLMGEHNRLRDDVELEVPGNPLLIPRQTLSVTAEKVELSAAANYWLKHIHHRFDASGYTSRLSLTGGVGDAGYSTEVDPVAAFSWFVDREFLGGVEYYTVTCDGSGSFDPDGATEDLTFAWENSANADTGTGPTYSTSFTAAEIAAGATITLTVTDADANTDASVQAITGASATTLARSLYVAASARAEATPDGGQTWYTWIPASGTVISTPELAYSNGTEGHSYFGLSDGKLYYTADLLATAPTLVHTFGDAVNCIWINETDYNRVVVGLDDGTIWQTVDAALLASATWAEVGDLTDPVLWVAESPMQWGQIWVCAGRSLYISFDGGGTFSAYATFPSGATARKFANSFMGNFVCASVGTGEQPVRDDADTEHDVPVMAPADEIEDCRAITHHLYDDLVWVCDLAGRFLEKAAADAAFAVVGTVTDDVATAGNVNHMVRDTAAQLVVYLACDGALVKTWDGGRTFAQLRDYTAAGEDGLQVGVGSLRLQVTTGRRVYVVGAGPTFAWTENVFDASPTWTANNTGLGAHGSTDSRLFLDPDSPDSRGYIYVPGVPALYRNDAMREAGSWASVMDATIFAALVEAIKAGSLSLGEPAFGTGGRVVIVYKYINLAETGVGAGALVSNDNGDTWTAVGLGGWSIAYSGYIGARGSAIGLTNNDIVYCCLETGAGASYAVHKSANGGVSFTAGATETTGNSNSRLLRLSKRNNASDLIGTMTCNLAAVSRRTTDGFAATPTTLAVGNVVPCFVSDADVAAGWPANGNDDDLYLSTDDGVSWSVAQTFASDFVKEIDAFNSTVWLLAKTGTNKGAFTCTVATLDAWTDRNGNLLALMANGPVSIKVDPSV